MSNDKIINFITSESQSLDWGATKYNQSILTKNQPRRKPLVAIMLSPIEMDDKSLENPIERFMTKASQKLGHDGWVIFYLYPELNRSNASLIFNQSLDQKNVCHLKHFIDEHHVREVWGLWGDFPPNTYQEDRLHFLQALQIIDSRVFYFGTLTADGNPRSPLGKEEIWHIFNANKNYLPYDL